MTTRRVVVLALLAALPVTPVLTAPPTSAETCVAPRLYVNGNQTGSNDCYKTDFGDVCVHYDHTYSNGSLGATGAGASACIQFPLAG